MKVKKLIEKLSKYDGELEVLGEFDMDGDEFMVKVEIDKVYKGNGCDDSWDFDISEGLNKLKKKYIIVKLK
jgi:hypothetical protein